MTTGERTSATTGDQRAPMTKQEEKLQAYGAMVRAVMIRFGGRMFIPADEMPTAPYSIMWRPTEDGGLEAILEDGKSPQ